MDDLETKLDASIQLVRLQKGLDEHGGSEPTFQFSETQKAMIRDTYANGASQKEFEVLLEIAKLRKLNPLLRQIHFVKRWNKALGRDVWSAQVSVDGLRAIAQRTGLYDGQDDAEFEKDDQGRIVCARVKVYRKDWSRPAVGTAYWSEYVQTNKDNQPTKFWADMPHVMLGKCAEAIAMRKAFPEDMGGLYTDEEMQQADSEPKQLTNPRSMHTLPGDNPDEPDRDNAEYKALMEELQRADRELFDPAVEYTTMLRWRNRLGNKAKGIRTDVGKTISKLYQEEGAISPGQRDAMSKLINRLDRKLSGLEAKLQPPPVEASFTDDKDDDGTDVFSKATEEE